MTDPLEHAVAEAVARDGARRVSELLALVADQLAAKADAEAGFPDDDDARKRHMDDLIRQAGRRAFGRNVSVAMYVDRMMTAGIAASAELAGEERTVALLRTMAVRIEEGALDLAIRPITGH